MSKAVLYKPLSFEDAVKVQRSLVPTCTSETQAARDQERADWERYHRACAIVDQAVVSYRAAVNYELWAEANPHTAESSVSWTSHAHGASLFKKHIAEFSKLRAMERGEEVQ